MDNPNYHCNTSRGTPQSMQARTEEWGARWNRDMESRHILLQQNSIPHTTCTFFHATQLDCRISVRHTLVKHERNLCRRRSLQKCCACHKEQSQAW